MYNCTYTPEATLIFIFPLPQVSFFLSFFLHLRQHHVHDYVATVILNFYDTTYINICSIHLTKVISNTEFGSTCDIETPNDKFDMSVAVFFE